MAEFKETKIVSAFDAGAYIRGNGLCYNRLGDVADASDATGKKASKLLFANI